LQRSSRNADTQEGSELEDRLFAVAQQFDIPQLEKVEGRILITDEKDAMKRNPVVWLPSAARTFHFQRATKKLSVYLKKREIQNGGLARLECQIVPRPESVGNAQRPHDGRSQMFRRSNNIDEAQILVTYCRKYARLFEVRREMRLVNSWRARAIECRISQYPNRRSPSLTL
jgi:hypothetical protein